MDLKGLILNKNIGTYPPGSWTFGKNIVISKDGQAVLNEEGFNYGVNTGTTIIGNISIGNTVIVFSCNGVNSIIGKVVDSIYTIILSEPLLNFSLHYPILGVATYNHKGEIIISFTDDYNSPKVLNIDDLPFPSGLDGSNHLVEDGEFTLCEVFPDVKNPSIKTIIVSDSGGSLKSGIYNIAIAYVFDDDSSTSWQDISNPIVVTQDSATSVGLQPDQYDGCDSGLSTSKSIIVDLYNLDINFSRLKVALISKINGVISVYETDTLYYTLSTKTVVISGTSLLNTLSIREVFTNNAIYLKARAIALVNNELQLANLVGLPKLDYQHYANNITVQWYRDDYVSLDSIKGSYKDSSILFTKKQFKSGEVYNLYIGLRLKKGGYYGVYHIPGHTSNYNDKLELTTLPYTNLADTPLLYQFKDTSTDESGNGSYGNMGFWENVNEKYPSDFVDFPNQNVRHHKFPDLARLESYKDAVTKKGFITIPSSPSGDPVLNTEGTIITTSFVPSYTVLIGSAYGTWKSDEKRYTANRNQVLNGYITFGSANALEGSAILLVDTLGNTTYLYTDFGGNYTYQLVNLFLGAGDYLIIGFHGIYSSVTNQFNFTATPQDNIIEGSLFTQPLGLKISNVEIPNELLPYVDGWEIFYAERTVDNMSIVGQDMLYGDTWSSSNYDYYALRIHAFDLMNTRLDVIPSYVNRLLDFTIVGLDVTTDPVCDYANLPYVDNDTLSDGDKILLVTTKGYFPAFINSTIYDNSKREDALILYTSDTIVNTAHHRFLADICIYKTDVYVGYQNQRLVSTGICVNVIDTIIIQPAVIIYGGDTVISRYAYRLDYIDTVTPANNKSIIPYIVAETVANANLRNENPLIDQIYYPKSSAIDMTTADIIALGNYWGYNTDYSSINDNTQPIIDYPNINLINLFPTRIIKSLPIQTENVSINWRTFLVTDYYEMPTNKGYINKLTSLSNKLLYIAHQYALFVATVKDTIDTTTGQLSIKEGNLFDRPPVEMIVDELGYIGNNCRFATLMCKYGYFTVDKQKGKVYLITDKVTDISDNLVDQFLKSIFVVIRETYDPILEETTTVNKSSEDNPFAGVGLVAGYDDVNDRLLLSFSNRDILSSGTGSTITVNSGTIADQSFTLSYNLKHNYWVAFHDYIINSYAPSRDGLLGIINSSGTTYAYLTSKLHKLNYADTYGRYPTITKAAFIDLVFDNKSQSDELIENVSYHAEIISNGITLWDKTLTHLMLSTKQQCSGEITLAIQTWANQLTTGNIKNVKGIWIINKFKDRLVSTNSSFLTVDGDIILTKLENEFVTSVLTGKKYIVSGIITNADYINYNGVNYTINGDIFVGVNGVTEVNEIGLAKIKNFKYWYEMSNIITNFAVVRLKYDNSEQLKMKVNNIMLNVK